MSSKERCECHHGAKGFAITNRMVAIAEASSSEQEAPAAACWRKRLQRNRLVVYMTLYGLSLEIPYQRYAFKESNSVLINRFRFVTVVALLFKLIFILAFSECEFAQWRGYVWDWTVYYPIGRRSGLIRTMICMLTFHLFLKISVFYYKRKSFESSLVDYLCREPPPPPLPQDEIQRDQGKPNTLIDESLGLDDEISFNYAGSEQNFSPRRRTRFSNGTNYALRLADKRRRRQRQRQRQGSLVSREPGRYLRDRPHWFALSDRLWATFITSAICIVFLCSIIIGVVSVRLGLLFAKERSCDVERPMLRIVGLLELNFGLVETVNMLIGSVSFCSLVKNDLLIQARRVERCLRDVFKRIESDEADHSKGAAEWAAPNEQAQVCSLDDLFEKPSRPSALLERTPNSVTSLAVLAEQPVSLGPAYTTKLGLADNTNQLSQFTATKLARAGSLQRVSSIKTRADLHMKLSDQLLRYQMYAVSIVSRSRTGMRTVPGGWRLGEHAASDFGATSDYDDWSVALELELSQRVADRNHGHENDDDDDDGHTESATTYRSLSSSMLAAQNKLILFLKCVDSHKQTMSFIGKTFLLYMLISITFVPLMISSYRPGSQERKGDLVYALTFVMSLATGLMYMLTGAIVHQRAINMASLVFSICSISRRRLLAARWNKIIMIWYCPNRCAFTVSGVFELTYLNVLKAFSFLISGLTLMLNYLSD